MSKDTKVKAVKNENITSAYDITKLGDEQIEDLFTQEFRGIADTYSNKITLSDFEAKVVRAVGAGDLKVEVRIYGMADVTPRSNIHNKASGKIHPALNHVKVSVPTKGVARFKMDGSSDLNTNDYVLYYTQEK